MLYLKKFIIFLFILLPLSMFALDMDDFEIGDTVYIDKWFIKDEKVKVLEKHYGDPKKVYVERKNGDKKWVKLSELMGTTGYVVEKAGKQALSSFFDFLKDANKRGPKVHIVNNCSYTVNVAINYLSSYENEWKTKYWYEFSPGESSYLDSVRTNNKLIYIYAKGSGHIWKGNDHYEYLNGEKKGMVEFKGTALSFCGN